jgi:hypothetical protein
MIVGRIINRLLPDHKPDPYAVAGLNLRLGERSLKYLEGCGARFYRAAPVFRPAFEVKLQIPLAQNIHMMRHVSDHHVHHRPHADRVPARSPRARPRVPRHPHQH